MTAKTAICVAAAVALTAGSTLSWAQDGSETSRSATYDYVQQAASMTFEGGTLTLSGLAPSTIFFADRPYRIAGHLTNQQFVDLWTPGDGEDDDSFASDPPNAALSVLADTTTAPAILELTGASVDGDTITYEAKVLAGDLPEEASDVALFIDRGGHGGGGGGGHGFGGGGRGFGGEGMGHGGRGFGGEGMGRGGRGYGGEGMDRGRRHRGVAGVHEGHRGNPYYPGPYCWHSPQAPECRGFHPHHPHHPYHPYGPYGPYGPYHPYHPYYPYYPAGAAAAGFAAGAAVGAAAASGPTYVYPVPAGTLPPNCWYNSNHTRMICSVPQN